MDDDGRILPATSWETLTCKEQKPTHGPVLEHQTSTKSQQYEIIKCNERTISVHSNKESLRGHFAIIQGTTERKDKSSDEFWKPIVRMLGWYTVTDYSRYGKQQPKMLNLHQQQDACDRQSVMMKRPISNDDEPRGSRQLEFVSQIGECQSMQIQYTTLVILCGTASSMCNVLG